MSQLCRHAVGIWYSIVLEKCKEVTDFYRLALALQGNCMEFFFVSQLRDEELSKEMQETNWFSAPSALRVYGQYLNLDRDHNGMLSKEELAR